MQNRDEFDDVDDYNGLTLSGSDIVGFLGGSITFQGLDVYSGYQADISVFYDVNQDGINDDDLDQNGSLDTGTYSANRKHINVTITTPDGEPIVFAAYRDNY